MNETEKRRKELVHELSLKHLPLRHDSRLCSSYISSELGKEWPISRVVHECCVMHWLYNYTLYPAKMREAHMYFSTILTSGKCVHDFIKQFIQPHIKSQTILENGGIPQQWPWLLPDSTSLSASSNSTT